jgi:hypothetical protein
MNYAKKVLLGGRLLIEIHGKVFTNRTIKNGRAPESANRRSGSGSTLVVPYPPSQICVMPLAILRVVTGATRCDPSRGCAQIAHGEPMAEVLSVMMTLRVNFN